MDQYQPQENLRPLLGKVLVDVRELAREELSLFRAEIKEDIRNFFAAVLSVAFSLGTILIGFGFLCLSAAHLLIALVPSFNPWQAYAVIFLLCIATAGLSLFFAQRRFQAIKVVPTRTIDSLTEDIRAIQETFI